jgi:3-hydroxyanthranilate 3,4-dioxygenase
VIVASVPLDTDEDGVLDSEDDCPSVKGVRENKGYKDGLLWFCDKCNTKLHETYFELQNIETDFLPHFKHYYGSEELRTCKTCGHVMEADPRFV